MACPKCGSWAVKADRGLGGRLVCARCGQPLGISAARQGPGRVRMSRPQRPGLWLGLTVLVLISALLAWQAEQRPAPARRLRLMGAEVRGYPVAAPRSAVGSVCPSADRSDPEPDGSQKISTCFTTSGVG